MFRCWSRKSITNICELIAKQQQARGWKGQIVTNPNCSTIVMTAWARSAEAVRYSKDHGIHIAGDLRSRLSGRASMDIIANVIPFIGGEGAEDGAGNAEDPWRYAEGEFRPLEAKVSAHCNRVPVVDGHMVCVSVELRAEAWARSRFAVLSNDTPVCRRSRICPALRSVPLCTWSRRTVRSPAVTWIAAMA